MQPYKRILVFVVLLLAACLVSTDAEARGGFVLITYGESIKEIGPVVAEHLQTISDETGVTPHIGFIHQQFGLFYLDLWTWDGHYCMYSGGQYRELEPEQAAQLLGISVDDLKKPLTYRVPPGLGLGFLAFAIFVIVRAHSRAKMNKLQRLFDDARYQRAIDLIRRRTEAAQDKMAGEPVVEDAFRQGFEDAVAYLTGEGVADSEARAQLQTMVTFIEDAQQAA